MDAGIAERDIALKAQADLIEDRARAMAHMSTEIAHRDEAIIAQGKLLEERFGAMEEMGREIHQLQTRIDILEANPLNRLKQFVNRLRRRLLRPLK